jgi:hypothetical protein
MNNLLRHLRLVDLELFVMAMHLKSLSRAGGTFKDEEQHRD